MFSALPPTTDIAQWGRHDRFVPNSDIRTGRTGLLSRALPADRYCELKNRAVGVRLDEPQFASVVLDYSRTDSEPHSHTAGFRRKERIEHALSILDRNSAS